MINTTMAYKKAIEKNRHFRIRDTIFLDDGEQITLSMEDVTAYSINEATSSDGKFEIGAAIVKEYKISLNNMDGVFDGIGFEGADVSAIIGLRLQDGTWEDLRKGQFRVVEAKARELTIDIRAYDAMLFFDRPYSESSMEYPASINQILIDACRVCQMTFNARTVQMGDYVVKKRPDDQALTFRDVISFCAQIMGCYAYINNLGQLEFGWYDFDALKFLRDGRYDGGIFDKNMPYLSGDAADGGNFLRWEEGDILDGGEFADMNAYHHIYLLKSKSVNTDDITITGVSISFKDNSGKEELLMYGNEGYVLELSGNPLIQENAGQVLQHVGEKVTGNTFRPMNVTTQSDPSMEAGDLAVVTDRKQRSYWTVITNTTFSLSGSQKIECSAETPAEKNYTRYGAVTKIVSETKKQTENQLSAYEISSRQFNDLMARSMGLYETYEKQEDGSIIKYQHDKPNLSESKTIWKQAGGAFGVSTDGGKTWNAGTDAEGNALFNVLATVGFYFDWAVGGTLTLGGEGNGNGVLIVKGEDNNEIGRWDKDGVFINKGEIAGPSLTLGGKNNSSGVLKILDNTGRAITNWDVLESYITMGNRDFSEDIGKYSFSSGDNNVASKDYTSAIGKDLRAIYRNQTVIGQYNDPGLEDPNGGGKAKWPFIIGNGTNDNIRGNGLVIDHSGNVGVSSLYLYQGKNGNAQTRIESSSEVSAIIRSGEQSMVFYHYQSSGQINFNSNEFSPSGSSTNLGTSKNPWAKVWAYNTTISSSDKRLKQNFAPLTVEYIKNFFMALKPTKYQFKTNTNGRAHWGMISQEVEEALKKGSIDTIDFSGFIIDKDENGNDTYFLAYEEFIAPIITMVQYLVKKIDYQEKQVNDLKMRIEKLESIIFEKE